MLDPLHIPGVFSHDECGRIIAAALAGAFEDAALVGGLQVENMRRSRLFWLDEVGREAWVFRRLLDMIAEANRHHFAFRLEEFAEKVQVAWYGAEPGGFFDWHVDMGDGATAARRKLTAIIQLSDGCSYDGGDLETNADGHIRGADRAIGSGLLMPSFVLHRVTPVTRGERYSLVLWAHGPDFC
jgi:PKHD-type hydroxylase